MSEGRGKKNSVLCTLVSVHLLKQCINTLHVQGGDIREGKLQKKKRFVRFLPTFGTFVSIYINIDLIDLIPNGGRTVDRSSRRRCNRISWDERGTERAFETDSSRRGLCRWYSSIRSLKGRSHRGDSNRAARRSLEWNAEFTPRWSGWSSSRGFVNLRALRVVLLAESRYKRRPEEG